MLTLVKLRGKKTLYLDRNILVSDIKWHENRETCIVFSSLLQEAAAVQ